nr:MAG TPA: hypothetical protein [Bacteriophage sp.]
MGVLLYIYFTATMRCIKHHRPQPNPRPSASRQRNFNRLDGQGFEPRMACIPTSVLRACKRPTTIKPYVSAIPILPPPNFFFWGDLPPVTATAP